MKQDVTFFKEYVKFLMISGVTVQFHLIYSEIVNSVESGSSAACTRNRKSCWQYVLGQFYKDTAGLRDDAWFLMPVCVSQPHNFRNNLPIFKESAVIAVLRYICVHRLQHWQHTYCSNIRIILQNNFVGTLQITFFHKSLPTKMYIVLNLQHIHPRNISSWCESPTPLMYPYFGACVLTWYREQCRP
jgi:hypothetical protein